MRTTLLKLAFLLIGMSQTPCRALEVLADNLTALEFGYQAASDAVWLSQEFETVVTNSTITQITLPMYRSPSVTGGNYVIAIYTNSGTNTPGTELHSLSREYTTLGTSVADINFDVSWNIADVGSYFVVVRGSSLVGGNIFWEYTNQDGSVAPFFVGFPSNYSVSTDTGSTWSTPTLATPQVMRVVPEPSTYVLSAIGFSAAIFMRRRSFSV